MPRVARLLGVLALVIVAGLDLRSEAADASIAELIAQLSDDNSTVGDAAEAKLVKIGPTAIPELKKAALGGRLEQRYRSLRVLERFALDGDQPSADAEEALLAVANGRDKSLARRAQKILEFPALLASMRQLAEAFEVYETRAGELQQALPIEQPLLRFSDDTVPGLDGTLWAYGREGRPRVLLCVFTHVPAGRPREWLSEAVSLADAEIEVGNVDGNEAARWSPPGSGLVWKPFPNAPAPGKTAEERLAQMQKLASRTEGRQFAERGIRPYDMALSSEPMLRYSEAAAGIVDGAIYGFVRGRDPELALLLEARKDSGQETWQYAVARLTAAPAFVEIDGREVWAGDTPKDLTVGGKNPYWLLRRRLSE
jgi:hypothetical protein